MKKKPKKVVAIYTDLGNVYARLACGHRRRLPLRRQGTRTPKTMVCGACQDDQAAAERNGGTT